MTATFQSAVFTADDTRTITLSNEKSPAGAAHKHENPLLCVKRRGNRKQENEEETR